MAKRFSDTEKWKKSFFRGLHAPYKLLWMYILDDCDIAGIWQVDMQIASIKIGEEVSIKQALQFFGSRVVPFDGGKKWFIADFIYFQYGELKTTNNMHRAVTKILRSNNIDFPPEKVISGAPEGLPSPQGKGQGYGYGQGEGKLKEANSKKIEATVNASEWMMWGESIVDESDPYWDQMRGRKVTQEEMNAFLSVATRNNWRMDTQQAFRISLNGFDWKPVNGSISKPKAFEL